MRENAHLTSSIEARLYASASQSFHHRDLFSIRKFSMDHIEIASLIAIF